MATQADFENLEFNPFQVQNTILLNNLKDPDSNFFNALTIDMKYYSPDVNMFEITETDKFSILHLNIRSMQKNFENFKDFLLNLNSNFHIICLTETWCQIKEIENKISYKKSYEWYYE